MSEQIVGHKTVRNDDGTHRHEPIYESEAEAIIAHIEAEETKRKELMPDEDSAIKLLFDACERLRDFGWNDPIYCPKDGSIFKVLELGSTGKHDCFYEGTWPDGSWWIASDGDVSPSRPAMFKKLDAK
jgi:MoaA/NifB/PqqE/SkfB family radical SAM enzyme